MFSFNSVDIIWKDKAAQQFLLEHIIDYYFPITECSSVRGAGSHVSITGAQACANKIDAPVIPPSAIILICHDIYIPF